MLIMQTDGDSIENEGDRKEATKFGSERKERDSDETALETDGN